MSRLRTYLCLVAMMAVSSSSIYAQKAKMVYSTATEKWIEAKKALTIEKSSAGEADITIYTDKPLQTIDGIGGAFNEIGWDVLQTLPQKSADEVMKSLFSPEGCNFSMGRVSVGANDYSLSYYSCCDVDEDFGMRDFNIDRDRYIILPYIKKAMELRPDLQMWASPWSPPAWMKINKHYSLRGGDWNDRENGNRMPEGADIFNNATGFNMQERYLQAYALYFSKFAQAYSKEGVDLFAIMPQNEIAYSPNWPSCTWRAEDIAYFIGKFMGPQFEKDGLDTKIWLGTINWSRPDYCETVLKSSDAGKYIAGIGFQWGGMKAIPEIHKNHPELSLMQTENMCGESENDWTSVERSWETIVHYMNNGANSYIYWNMILDETGMSAWGWPQNSMIVVDRESHAVKYTDEFYLFKHLGHYVQPGSKKLEASSGKNHVAFELPNGSTMVMIYNDQDADTTLKVKVGETMISANLKAKSINSIVVE